VLVANRDLVVIAQVGGERCQAERRKEGVLDWSEERAPGLSKGGEDHLDPHQIGAFTASMHPERDP